MGDGLGELDLAALRARRDEVRAQETAVSYRRRLVQAQLDIVAGIAGDSEEQLEARLASVLADRPDDADSLSPRAVGTVVHDLEGPDALPEDLRSATAEERAALIDRLTDVEHDLSQRRRELLDELDTLQAELVRRYRDGGVDTATLLGDTP